MVVNDLGVQLNGGGKDNKVIYTENCSSASTYPLQGCR